MLPLIARLVSMSSLPCRARSRGDVTGPTKPIEETDVTRGALLGNHFVLTTNRRALHRVIVAVDVHRQGLPVSVVDHLVDVGSGRQYRSDIARLANGNGLEDRLLVIHGPEPHFLQRPAGDSKAA